MRRTRGANHSLSHTPRLISLQSTPSARRAASSSEWLQLKYLSNNNLLPDRQFAYRASISVYRDCNCACAVGHSDRLGDKGDIAALTLLDLSAAFDTVDHATLLRRLQTSFGLGDSALSWFHSYLSQRRQHVVHQGNSSPSSVVEFGVPHGSVLGPILFIMGIHGRRHTYR